MAHVKKIVTYDLPDRFEGTERTMGKTSTESYDGPAELILWIDKESKEIEQTWDKDAYTDRPVPLNCEVKTIKADSDENIIKIGILFGGFDSHGESAKLYEVRVGPAEDKNVVLPDMVHPQQVFSENGIVEDYTKPLVFRVNDRIANRTDDFIRGERNAKLQDSDSRVSETMPEADKAEWETYRQKLRDIPQDWANVPNTLIMWPQAPDGEYPEVALNDPEHPVIKVADRTAADADAMAQLTPITGIDE